MPEDFIDLSGVELSDTFEPTVRPAGEEMQLRVVSFRKATNKNGDDYVQPFFEVMEDDYCKEFGDYLELPHEGMSPKQLNNAKLAINSFSQAFDVDFSGELDIKNDIVGKVGWAILSVTKDQDGNPVNSIRRYVEGA